MKTIKSKFDENFKRKYNENSDKGYIFQVDVKYPNELQKLHNNIPFLAQRMKIKKRCKLLCNLFDKGKYVKPALNRGKLLKKVHKVIKFNQKAWLKPYVDINTKLITEAKNDFEKNFFKIMNNSVFGKTIKNVRNQTTNKRTSHLVSEPNYDTRKCFSENLLEMEIDKIKVRIKKLVYLGLSIL